MDVGLTGQHQIVNSPDVITIETPLYQSRVFTFTMAKNLEIWLKIYVKNDLQTSIKPEIHHFAAMLNFSDREVTNAKNAFFAKIS